MAVNFNPVFAVRPEMAQARIVAATTDKTGATTTNLVELVQAETDGTKVTWIKAKHVGDATAGIFLIFVSDTSGTNLRLFSELTYSTKVQSTTVSSDDISEAFPDLQLKAGQKIFVGATVVTSNIDVHASLGHFGTV